MKYATTILVFCVAALLSLGLVMLYSSSMSPTGASYPAAQVLWSGLGLIAAGIVACVDYRHLKKISIPLFLFAAASKFLPKTAHSAMQAQGIDFQGVIEAAKAGEFSGPIIDIFEPKTNDRVVISIE